jgi:ABC-type transporter Mla subunit MlaD
MAAAKVSVRELSSILTSLRNERQTLQNILIRAEQLSDFPNREEFLRDIHDTILKANTTINKANDLLDRADPPTNYLKSLRKAASTEARPSKKASIMTQVITKTFSKNQPPREIDSDRRGPVAFGIVYQLQQANALSFNPLSCVSDCRGPVTAFGLAVPQPSQLNPLKHYLIQYSSNPLMMANTDL